MRWNSPIEKPVEGDLKVITKFAWLPTQVRDQKVWLESYEQLWEYVRRRRVVISGNVIGPAILCNDWDLISQRVISGLPKLAWIEFLKKQQKVRFMPKDPRDRGNSNIQPDRWT